MLVHTDMVKFRQQRTTLVDMDAAALAQRKGSKLMLKIHAHATCFVAVPASMISRQLPGCQARHASSPDCSRGFTNCSALAPF
jgi:hypothetical protein